MTLSKNILSRIIAEAAEEANTVEKIMEVTDLSSPGARFATGVNAIARFAKNILGDIATYDMTALNNGIYGSDIQTFTEITRDTAGFGLVPPGTTGSPQPLLEGLLLSYGAEGKKVQLLAFTTGTLWFKLETGDSRQAGKWQKINPGIVDHRFYSHAGNNLFAPDVNTYYYDIPAYASSVIVRLRGAGGGGSGDVSVDGVFKRGFAAGNSSVRHLFTNDFGGEDIGFSITAAGGRAGNDDQSDYPSNKETTNIPDARRARSPREPFTIAGLGEPGGISKKVINRSSQANTNFERGIQPVIPQDGLAGALAVGSFDPFDRGAIAAGRLEIKLAPGGRRHGGHFHQPGDGYDGKAASVEIIVR